MRRVGILHTTGVPSFPAPASLCHLMSMADSLPPATIDEASGLRALAALLDGDLDRATEALAVARRGYRVAFLCRLAVVVPTASIRLAWRLVVRW